MSKRKKESLFSKKFYLFPLLLLIVVAFNLFTLADWADHVVISEVMPDPAANESSAEWVELYNPTAETVDLGGWELTEGSEAEATLPSGAKIRAHGYYLIGDDGWAPGVESWPDPDHEENISLTNSGGHIELRKENGDKVDLVGWGDSDSESYEGPTALEPPAEGNSLARKAFPSSTSTSMSSAGEDEEKGNGEDSDSNEADYIERKEPEPQNSDSFQEPLAEQVWVSPGYGEGDCDGHTWGYDAFAKLRQGVELVKEEGRVNLIGPGSFDPAVISRPLALSGASSPRIKGEGGPAVKVLEGARVTIERTVLESDSADLLVEAGAEGKSALHFCNLNGSGLKVKNLSEETVLAENNWWGTNSPGPGEDYEGPVQVSPHVQLRVLAEKEDLQAGEECSLKVSLRKNSEGVDLVELAGGSQLPDGLLVDLSTTLGSFENSSKTRKKMITDGAVSAVLSSSKAGETTVEARMGRETVSEEITFRIPGSDQPSIHLQLSTHLLECDSSSTVTARATVKDKSGNPLPDKRVDFELTKGELSNSFALTDSEGEAAIRVAPPSGKGEVAQASLISARTKISSEEYKTSETLFLREPGDRLAEGGQVGSYNSKDFGQGERRGLVVGSNDDSSLLLRPLLREEAQTGSGHVAGLRFEDNPKEEPALRAAPGGFFALNLEGFDRLEGLKIRAQLSNWPEEPRIKYWEREEGEWKQLPRLNFNPKEGYIETVLRKEDGVSPAELDGSRLAVGGLHIREVTLKEPGWHLVSLPLRPEQRKPEEVFPGLALEGIFHWDQADSGGEGGYLSAADGGYDSMRQAEGCWVFLGPEGAPRNFRVAGTYDHSIEIRLKRPGWHQIGVPMAYEWGDIGIKHGERGKVFLTSERKARKLIQRHLFAWSNEEKEYLYYTPKRGSLIPGRAYWVKTKVADVRLIVPYGAPPPAPNGDQPVSSLSVALKAGGEPSSELEGVSPPPAPPGFAEKQDKGRGKRDNTFSDAVARARPNPAYLSGGGEVEFSFVKKGEPAEQIRGLTELILYIRNAEGKLIYKNSSRGGDGLSWPLRDREGSKVANGIYFFNLVAERGQGKVLSSSARKLLVLR